MNRRGLSILAQLLLLIATATLVPLVFLGYTTYSTYKINTQTTSINNNFVTLNQAEQNISNLVRTVSSIINNYDNNTTYSNTMTRSYDDDMDILRQNRTVEDTLQVYLSTISVTSLDIILLGENGLLYSTSSNPPKISPISIYNTYWYKETYNSSEINWFIFERSFFTENLTHPVVVATKSLYDYTTGKKYGTCIIEIDEYYLYDLYKDVVGSDEYFMIQDSTGTIITTSDRTMQLSLNSNKSIMNIETENLIYGYQYKDKAYTYISRQSSISDWTLIKLLSNVQINKDVNILQRNFITIYIICILLILIGVYIIAYRITKPIKTLTAKIQNNFIHDTYSSNNISPLTITKAFTSFEVLIEEVDDTIKKLLTENEARISAELYALKMQINPHFLYNTLNSIKCLVWTDKIDLIEPTITSLVKLLQQTLKKPGDLITLKEELALLKHYVYIQNIRTEDSITLNESIRKADYNILVPSLLLQPIIENSIFHGIEPTGLPGTISLSSHMEEDDLILEVFDNGIGMDTDTRLSLLDKEDDQARKGFNGIGLSNIHRRLKMYYGDSYGLQIRSQNDVGTSVTLKIKAAYKDKEVEQ